MLKESIETVKNPQLEILKINTEINFFDEAFIPDQYLPSPTERLKIYRRINEIKEKDNLDKLKIELIDRCGKHINEVDALFSNAELILLSKELSIDKISSHKDDTRIYFNKKIDDQIFNKVLELIKTDPGMYKMSPSGNLKIEIENNKNSNQRRKIVRNLLHEII
jgi:transcription-repair coupling factor (superfamily II helicase)